VAQYRDLYVLGVRRRAQTDQTEDLPDDHESQGARHHGPILSGHYRACSQPGRRICTLQANCAGPAKRSTSPISATNTAARMGPTPRMAWIAL
jgi:hypothetical protein